MLALLAGGVTGRWDVALPLGIVVELFWLDVIPLGPVVPPVGSLTFLLTFSMVQLFELQVPAQLGVPLLCTLGCAYLAGRLECRQRLQANVLADIFHESGGRLSPERLVWRSLILRAVQQGFLYLGCFATLFALLRILQTTPLGIPALPQLQWNLLYVMGALGALLALRTHRAYAMFGAALAAVLCFWGYLPRFL